MDRSKLTPAQKQYWEIKDQHPDSILFFRMGDFYETFHEDAKICSKVLEIALTARDKNSENPIPMAGIPHHASEKYIPKLVGAGYKVAVAEQIGSVVPGQIVKRDVTSIITPGTIISEADSKKYNFIGGVTLEQSTHGNLHFAWGDFSLGNYFTKSFNTLEELTKFILKIGLSELIIDIDFPQREELQNYISNYGTVFTSIYDKPYDTENLLKTYLKVQNLDSYGQALIDGRKLGLGLLFNYLKDTQKTSLKNVSRISYHGDDSSVSLDDITIKNLELLRSSYELSKKHSILGVIDNTSCAMGGRLLINLLVNPVGDTQILNKRYDGIGYYFDDFQRADEIINTLRSVGDIPRTISTLIYKKNSPFILNRLKSTLNNIYENGKLVEDLEKFGLQSELLNKIGDFTKRLDSSLKDEGFSEDLDYIKDGFNSEIDDLRKIAYHSDDLLIQYQQKLVEKTGLGKIKIRFINNQGYFIEVSKLECAKFESFTNESTEDFNFMRRQTLKSVERYVTTELEDIQGKIISSKDKLAALEKQILEEFRQELESMYVDFSNFADYVGWLDLFTSMGKFAKNKSWTKPDLNMNYEFDIQGGRHPVIEEYLPMDEQFVPNDLEMSKKESIHIITGPNMGGKSTFLRQNAIIVLLAHCGLWVPAKKAKIGVVDGIYARVGSGDIIAKNQSTFMTEMIEVSNIMNNATNKSFIILDELGRGTSTYDGVALAKAIVEFISDTIGAKTLFATHYHELIKLEGKLSGVINYSVSVYETDKQVVFLKKIVKGGASKSYGIDVADLAGLPNSILESAKKHLKNLESNKQKIEISAAPLFDMPTGSGEVKEVIKEDERVELYEQLKNQIDGIDINNITPLQALEILGKLKGQ